MDGKHDNKLQKLYTELPLNIFSVYIELLGVVCFFSMKEINKLMFYSIRLCVPRFSSIVLRNVYVETIGTKQPYFIRIKRKGPYRNLYNVPIFYRF